MPTHKLDWLHAVHHDGSSVYVSNPFPRAGETVQLRLRTPPDAPIQRAYIRSVPDGEAHYEPLQPVEEHATYMIWEGDFTLRMPLNPYRFKLLTDFGAVYATALGASQTEKPDWFDFKLLADYRAASWVYRSVFYQIFPDRFYNGDPTLTPEEGTWQKRGFAVQQRNWEDHPLPWSKSGNLDFYGGDLVGIRQKIDYLQDLGVNALYLNPIFRTQTNHGYDIVDFDQVAAHMGGNGALVELRQALDEANMRLILDVTPNHISWQHPWFVQAQADMNAETVDYFIFFDNDPNNYEAWAGVPSLPKLNYRTEAVRDRMYRAPDSVLRQWLKPPYRIDGWRLDVLNMTARHGMQQLGDEVGRELRHAIKNDNPEAYILGEHFYDATPHLQGDQLDATMNYQGFNVPVRRWLCGKDVSYEHGPADQVPPFVDRSLLDTKAMAEQMQHYLAAVPYVIALGQFNQLDNHDTLRFLNAVEGDTHRFKVAAALLMTFPGVPCVYYGDEIGLSGEGDPDNRRPMPWNESEWDTDLREYYKTLIHLRRRSTALAWGGFQWLFAEGDVLAYQRQSSHERWVVVGYRGTEAGAVRIPVQHGGVPDGSRLGSVFGDARWEVSNGHVHFSLPAHAQAWVLRQEAP